MLSVCRGGCNIGKLDGPVHRREESTDAHDPAVLYVIEVVVCLVEDGVGCASVELDPCDVDVDLFAEFGFSPSNVVARAKALLER